MKLSVEQATRMYYGAGEALRMVARERITVKRYGVSLGVDKAYYLESLTELTNNLVRNGNEALAVLKRTPGYNTNNMNELKG